MNQSTLWWRALVLSTIALCISFAVGASGQDKKPGGFATVDFEKIQNDYRARAVFESEANALSARLKQQLARRDAMPLLTEEEQKTLDQLNSKPPDQRTPEEKKKIEELEKKGLQLAAEIQALQQKPDKDLTEADKKKLKDAEESFNKARQVFATLQEESETRLKQFLSEHREKLVKEVKDAVRKVAEQKGLAIVFNSEIAPYAGIDITPQVLSELNKK